METKPRRRVLFVRPRPNPQAANFLLRIANETAEALVHHVDVTTIDHDFDFGEVCDKVQPDFVLFDMVRWLLPHRPRIANLNARPDLPRALLLYTDPHDPLRPLVYETLDTYGIDTIFEVDTESRQHMPELDCLPCYSVPHFVDATVFRDYGLEKTIPVSIFGGHMAHNFYPWRAQITADLPRLFPTFIYTHPGYKAGEIGPFAVQGEAYARLINQSHFSAADTARFDYVVRKHIEIPAAGAILVAPTSSALANYGFVDLENCILGSGQELYEKIDAVSRDPERRERIRKAGFDLVHARYTREAWRFIPDWFECRRSLKPGETVQQAGRFGPFRAVPAMPAPPSVADCMLRDNPMSTVLRAGRDAILTGDGIGAAEQALTDAAGWIGHIAEPCLLLAVIGLLRGEAVSAAILIGRRAEEELKKMGDMQFATLDPVEIAWLMLAAHVLDHTELGQAMRDQAAVVPHLALRRMAWLVDPQGPDPMVAASQIERRLPGDRLSTHWLGQEDFSAWSGLVDRVLVANNKTDLAARLRLVGSILAVDPSAAGYPTADLDFGRFVLQAAIA